MISLMFGKLVCILEITQFSYRVVSSPFHTANRSLPCLQRVVFESSLHTILILPLEPAVHIGLWYVEVTMLKSL
jgi:hypothetical protein